MLLADRKNCQIGTFNRTYGLLVSRIVCSVSILYIEEAIDSLDLYQGCSKDIALLFVMKCKNTVRMQEFCSQILAWFICFIGRINKNKMTTAIENSNVFMICEYNTIWFRNGETDSDSESFNPSEKFLERNLCCRCWLIERIQAWRST